jgi:hypothetical protein
LNIDGQTLQILAWGGPEGCKEAAREALIDAAYRSDPEGRLDAKKIERAPKASNDQATKGTRWMPWRRKAMKDVVSCEKLREAANRR